MNDVAVTFPNMNGKSIFKSKTAIVNTAVVIAGAVGFANDDFRAWLAANTTQILTVLGLVNVWLRWITKGRVRLFDTDA